MNVQRDPCCTFILFPAPTQGRRTLESRQRFSDTPRMNVQLRPSRLLDLRIRWSSTPGRGHLTAGQGPGRSGGAWSEGGARAAAAAGPHPTARAPRQPPASAVRPQPGPDDTCAPAWAPQTLPRPARAAPSVSTILLWQGRLTAGSFPGRWTGGTPRPGTGTTSTSSTGTRTRRPGTRLLPGRTRSRPGRRPRRPAPPPSTGTPARWPGASPWGTASPPSTGAPRRSCGPWSASPPPACTRTSGGPLRPWWWGTAGSWWSSAPGGASRRCTSWPRSCCARAGAPGGRATRRPAPVRARQTAPVRAR